MRIDHYAYQRAARVAWTGFGLQAVMGIALLLLGMNLPGKDSAFVYASLYVMTGAVVWIGLGIIFHQHKLDRLEALEEDELAASRGAESFFEREGAGTHVAARRLGLMHKWLMPGLSLAVAACLTGLGFVIINTLRHVHAGTQEFYRTDERGWAVAICLAVAGLSFMFSRFVAGMSKQAVWSNLRGGASYMVGNALVMIAVAVGIAFRFFEKENVIEAICYGIPVLMFLLAFEILLNFILNLYRPRIPGETPRPAFDSKILSLFAAPDSIVRSVNEAVNYQFGFDVASSWGYQLLLRSFVSLAVLGVAALLALSTMVVVEPNQQAVRLRGGRLVDGSAHGSGVMWKLPWPIETAEVYDVTRVRKVYLTPRVVAQDRIPEDKRIALWSDDDSPKTDEVTPRPFIVGSQYVDPEVLAAAATRPKEAASQPDVSPGHDPSAPPATQTSEERAAQELSMDYALVEAEVTMQYRIKSDGGGLLDYLQFGTEDVQRRQTLTDRERGLKLLALSQVSAQMAKLSLDDVLSPGQASPGGQTLAKSLKDRVQAELDAHHAGVEVVSIDFPSIRPSGDTAKKFEEVGVSAQARLQRRAQADRERAKTFTYVIGDESQTDRVVALIDEFDRLVVEGGRNSPDAIAKRAEIERILMEGKGQAAQTIASAEGERWSRLMSQRAQAMRVAGQLAAYRASPEIYRQREIMDIYGRYLPVIDKYIIAIDPGRVRVDIDWKKVAPNLNFAGASEVETNRQ